MSVDVVGEGMQHYRVVIDAPQMPQMLDFILYATDEDTAARAAAEAAVTVTMEQVDDRQNLAAVDAVEWAEMFATVELID